MALNLRSPCATTKQTVKACSRPRSRLVCKAVLNLEPPKHLEAHPKRDVSAKASAEAEALLLPDLAEQPQQVATPSLLDAIIDNTVRVPYTAYSRALAEQPLATKAATSMMGFILGDLIAQVSYRNFGNASGPACVQIAAGFQQQQQHPCTATDCACQYCSRMSVVIITWAAMHALLAQQGLAVPSWQCSDDEQPSWRCSHAKIVPPACSACSSSAILMDGKVAAFMPCFALHLCPVCLAACCGQHACAIMQSCRAILVVPLAGN